MNYYTTLKNGKASQAQPSGGGGGFFDWLGGLFSGIGSIKFPSFPAIPGGGETKFQPFQFPNQPNQSGSLLNNPVVMVGVVLVGIIIVKKLIDE